MKDLQQILLLGPLSGFAMLGVMAWSLHLTPRPSMVLLVVAYFILITAAITVFGKWLKRRPDWKPLSPRARDFVVPAILGPMVGFAIVGAEATFIGAIPTNGHLAVAVIFGINLVPMVRLAAKELRLSPSIFGPRAQ